MHGSQLPVQSLAPVVVQPVRDVRVLLDLAKNHSSAGGMHRAGRYENAVALACANPAHAAFDAAVGRLPLELLRIQGGVESETEKRFRFSGDYVPQLCLARLPLGHPRSTVVRMHLDGEIIGSEYQLGGYRQCSLDTASAGVATIWNSALRPLPRGSHHARTEFSDQRIDRPASVRSRSDNTAVVQAPRLADPARRRFENWPKVVRAPDLFVQRGTELQRFQPSHVSPAMKSRIRRIPSSKSSIEAA